MPIRLCTFLLMAVGWLTAMADNVVTLSGASGLPGEEVELKLSLSNTDPVAMAEVVIPLDANLGYVSGSCTLNAERSDGHQVSAAVVDGGLRIYIFNMTGNALKGNSGDLCTFRLKFGQSSCQFTPSLQVVLASSEGKELPCTSSAGSIVILAPYLTIETAEVDYGRVPIRSQYSRTVQLRNTGTSPLQVTDIQYASSAFSSETSFVIPAGSSKQLSVSYSPTTRGNVQETATVISNAVNGTQTFSLKAQPYSVNTFAIGNASGSVDSEVTVAVSMANMEPIAAVQCEIPLPVQLEYVEGSFAVTDRSGNLSVMAYSGNGKLMLYLFSTSNDVIQSGSGEIATFRLRLKGRPGNYRLSPNDVVLGNQTGENMVSGSTGGTVTISSPIYDGAANLNMGKQDVTKDVTSTYSIRNSGNYPLVIDRVCFLSDEDYSIDESLPLTINAGKSANITVRYKPESIGAFATTMQVYNNDPDVRMKSVAISGSTYAPNGFSIDGTMTSDGYQLDVVLNNYTEIVAAQLDVHLPDGVEAPMENIVKSDRLNGMSFTWSEIGTNTYRAIIYSVSNNCIAGNEGTVFAIALRGNIPYGQSVTIDDVILGDSDGQDFTSVSSAVHKILKTPIFVPDYASTAQGGGEDYTHLFDEDHETKWGFSPTGGAYVVFHPMAHIVANSYTITTGNDNSRYHGRNPKSWKLYGSNSATCPSVYCTSWTLIASVTNDEVLLDRDWVPYTFPLDVKGNTYTYYKLQIESNKGDGYCQISEFSVSSEEVKTTNSLKAIDATPSIRELDDPYTSICDVNQNAKWGFFPSQTEGAYGEVYVIMQQTESVKATGYSITTGFDSRQFHERNPSSWRLYGSMSTDVPAVESNDWILLDVVNDEAALPGANNQEFMFDLPEDKADTYKFYKWVIVPPRYDYFQVREFRIYGDPVPDVLRGDANGDGKVDVKDAVLINNYYMDKKGITLDETAADANEDGVINVKDAVWVVNTFLNRVKE